MSLWTISVLPISSSFFSGLKVSARGILFLEIGKSEGCELLIEIIYSV